MRTAGAAILAALILVAAAAPWFASRDPFAMAAPPLMPPGADHLFGTDDLGRDVYAGVVHGARTSLFVGVTAAALAGALGLLVGGLAAVRGGLADHVLMRGTDFVQALPRFFLIVTIVSLFGHRFGLIVLAIGLTEWPATARLFRAHAATTLARDFTFAARAAGASDMAILARHVLPLSLPVMAAQISFHAGGAILVEAALSLLGLGDPTVMSWGTLLGAAQRFVREAWWMSLFPGLAITLTVLGCNLLAEGLTRRPWGQEERMTTILLARVASMLVVAASGTLQPGRVAGRALTVGDQHSWSVDAEEGHYIHVVVDQHGIDVVASVLDPAGQTAATVDTPNGDLGPEHVRFVARVRGPYRIDLKAAQPEAERGRYTIHLIERRPATANDRRIVAAIAEQTEADRLRANPATRQESLERYDRAMAIWRDAGDRAGEAGALRAKGFAYVRLRDDGHAYETFSRTRAMWRELGDLRSEAFALLILGTIHTRKDEPLETRARASEALPLWRRAGDREEEAFTLGEIGTTYARLKDRPGTEAWYRDALGVARKSHRRALEAAILDNFARAYGQLDDQPAALETHERARVKWQQARHRRGQAGSLRSIGAIHEALGETAKAIEAYMKAADLWRQAGVLQEETVDRARADKLRR